MASTVKTRQAFTECAEPKADEDVFKKIREKGRRAINWHKMPKDGVLLITGFRGEGKTALSWWLVDTLRQVKGYPRQVVAYGLHPDALAALPKWARNSASSPAEVSALTKPSMIVVDEAVFSANARRSMSEENVDWMKLFAIVRHKGHLLIFIAQTSRQVDIQLIDQADLILMKKPSMMQVKTARTELKAQVKEALALLHQKRNSKDWVYVYDPKTDAGKLLPSAMPMWWTDKLSKAYSAVTL